MQGKKVWIVLNSNHSKAGCMDEVCLRCLSKFETLPSTAVVSVHNNLLIIVLFGQLKHLALSFFFFIYFLKHTFSQIGIVILKEDKQEEYCAL